MDLGLTSPGAHRKHKAVSKGPGVRVVCGSLRGVGMMCCGETGQHSEAGGGQPGAPGTCEGLVAWPGPAVLGSRQCLVQTAMPG